MEESFMYSRREFLSTISTGAAAAMLAPARTFAAARALSTPIKGVVGLQLWSLRESLPKDLAGTLSKIRAMGFEQVEGAGLWGHTVKDVRAALDAAGLKCPSAHMGDERLRDDMAGAFAEARAMGASWIVCPWITHGQAFTRDDAMKAAELFNRVGKAAAADGLHFGYHTHGYEFVPSPDGTLFDTLAKNTDPETVAFQIDLLHTFHGGGDPVAIIGQQGRRVASLHLKDLKKDVPRKAGAAGAAPDEEAPVGSGQVDMPAVFRAAAKAGTAYYFVEDESRDPLGNIPKSVAYLETVKF
jgi:sugar phosphate isomerase/epimerase